MFDDTSTRTRLSRAFPAVRSNSWRSPASAAASSSPILAPGSKRAAISPPPCESVGSLPAGWPAGEGAAAIAPMADMPGTGTRIRASFGDVGSAHEAPAMRSAVTAPTRSERPRLNGAGRFVAYGSRRLGMTRRTPNRTKATPFAIWSGSAHVPAMSRIDGPLTWIRAFVKAIGPTGLAEAFGRTFATISAPNPLASCHKPTSAESERSGTRRPSTDSGRSSVASRSLETTTASTAPASLNSLTRSSGRKLS